MSRHHEVTFGLRALCFAITILSVANPAVAQVTPASGCRLTAAGMVTLTTACQVSFLSPPNSSQGSAIVNATTTLGNQRITITAAVTFTGPLTTGNFTQSDSRVQAFQFQVMQAGPPVLVWMGHRVTAGTPAGAFQLNIRSLTPGAAGSSSATAHGTFNATVSPMQGGNAKGNIVLNVTF